MFPSGSLAITVLFTTPVTGSGIPVGCAGTLGAVFVAAAAINVACPLLVSAEAIIRLVPDGSEPVFVIASCSTKAC